MSAQSRRVSLQRVRAGLVLVVALFVALEGLRYFSTALWRQQFEVLPSVSVRPSGETVFWKSRWVDTDVFTAHYESNVYDDARQPTVWTEKAPKALLECVATAWFGQPQMDASPLYRSGTYGPPWMPIGRTSQSRRLQAMGQAPSSTPLDFALAGQFHGGVLNARWRLTNGRMVLHGPDARVIGGFGPDGWKDGPDGAAGASFVRPWQVCTFWDMRPKVDERKVTLVLADTELRSVFFVRATMAENGRPRPADTPGWISCTRVPVEGRGEIRPLSAYAAGTSPLAVAVGDEVVAFTAEGRERGRAPLPAGETPLATIAGAWPVAPRAPDPATPVVVATVPAPVRVIGARFRMRLLDTGKPPVVVDVDLVPVTAGERTMAWARRSLAIVRPPVLSVASYFTDAPADAFAMFATWLTDPLYAGGNETLTLALCLLLGAACAARARSEARIRCPAPASVQFWTASAFVLGPVGLAWMRIVVPKHAVVACACGVRRAVSVETCPGCAAGWPAPAKTGVEVFA